MARFQLTASVTCKRTAPAGHGPAALIRRPCASAVSGRDQTTPSRRRSCDVRGQRSRGRPAPRRCAVRAWARRREPPPRPPTSGSACGCGERGPARRRRRGRPSRGARPGDRRRAGRRCTRARTAPRRRRAPSPMLGPRGHEQRLHVALEVGPAPHAVVARCGCSGSSIHWGCARCRRPWRATSTPLPGRTTLTTLGAHVGQDHGAERAGHVLGEVDDTEAGQRPGTRAGGHAERDDSTAAAWEAPACARSPPSTARRPSIGLPQLRSMTNRSRRTRAAPRKAAAGSPTRCEPRARESCPPMGLRLCATPSIGRSGRVVGGVGDLGLGCHRSASGTCPKAW